MKIVCCCFSGTGNTKHACEALLSELEKRGHMTSFCPIRADADRPETDGCDCLIVGYPVHGFNAPKPVLKFLKSLKKTKNATPCYLLRTSGEPLRLNDASGITPRRILKKKGYRVLGEFHYVLPYNIIFRHSDGMASRMELDLMRRPLRTESEGGTVPPLRLPRLQGRTHRNARHRQTFQGDGEVHRLRKVRFGVPAGEYPHGTEQAPLRKDVCGVHGLCVFLPAGRRPPFPLQRVESQRRLLLRRSARDGRGSLQVLPQGISALFPRERTKPRPPVLRMYPEM